MRKTISITESHNERTYDKSLNVMAEINESPIMINLKDKCNVAVFFGDEDNVKIYLLEKESNDPIAHYIINNIGTLRAFLSDSFTPPILGCTL